MNEARRRFDVTRNVLSNGSCRVRIAETLLEATRCRLVRVVHSRVRRSTRDAAALAPPCIQVHLCCFVLRYGNRVGIGSVGVLVDSPAVLNALFFGGRKYRF